MPDIQAPTALSLIRVEIDRFLSSDKAEVLCIRGKWGVGKTFTWEMLLKDARKRNLIEIDHYAYVSLFGLDTLDKFKSAVFENTIPITAIGTEPNAETVRANIRRTGFDILKAFRPGFASAAENITFLTVSNIVLCIDDLERKGAKLRVIDVLGLASLLKERRKCKVVLILNEEEFVDAKDREAFEKYSEKVIDTSIVFAPTPQEAADIAFDKPASYTPALKSYCLKLGVANIRILRKIERLVAIVEPSIRQLHPNVLNQAISTLVLFGWCIYGKQDTLLSFATEKRYRSQFGLNDGKLSEDEKACDDKLEGYGFGLCDEFDKCLLTGIKAGFFDTPELMKSAKDLSKTFNEQATKEIIDKPWALYRGSFDDNVDQILSEIDNVIHKHIVQVSVSYLDATASKGLEPMGLESPVGINLT